MSERHYIHEFPNGTLRDATPDEVAAAQMTAAEVARLTKVIEEVSAQRKALTNGCKHPVCWDEEGHPYDIRKCLRCGHEDLI